MTSKGLLLTLIAITAVASLGGCKTPKGDTLAEQRASVLQMRDDALTRLYADRPGTKELIAAAPGYAVFSNYGIKILIAGTGNGYGVLHDNATNKDVFMRMAEVNVGLGIALNNFRAVFVFNNAEVMHKFSASGWDFAGDAEAGAKLDHEGAEATVKQSVQDMDIYIFTKSGIALAASVGGTKYYPDKKLNAAE